MSQLNVLRLADCATRRNRASTPPETDTEVWTGSPCLVITSIASNCLCGRYRSQQLGGTLGNSKLGLPARRYDESGGELSPQPRFLTALDERLITPAVDRLLGDIETYVDRAS